MKTRFLVKDGEVVAVPLPAPDFSDLERAVKAAVVVSAPATDDLVDSAGHRIGNYL